MLDTISKAFFHTLAGSRTIEKLASRYGMAKPTSFGRRFIAGETLDEAIAAARAIQSQGMSVTLDQLGESVASIGAADAATRGYVEMIAAIVGSGVERNISIKLSQLGLEHRSRRLHGQRPQDPGGQPAARVLRPDRHGGLADGRDNARDRRDVCGSRDIGSSAWSSRPRSAGASRTPRRSARRESGSGSSRAPTRNRTSVAYQRKADVDAAFRRIMEALLREGTFPAIATHDPVLIEAAKRFAADRGIANDRFEFQMLYGIRRDLQAALVSQGYGVRLYVPFGRQWFPYFMRRLGERPANVGFVLRALIRDR